MGNVSVREEPYSVPGQNNIKVEGSRLGAGLQFEV